MMPLVVKKNAEKKATKSLNKFLTNRKKRITDKKLANAKGSREMKWFL
jgi:hypothetical protein